MTMHVRGRLMRTGAGLAFERKDAGSEPTLTEINEAVKKLMTNFEETKSANDLRLKEIEKKGSADVVLTEKIQKLDNDFAQIHKDLQTKLQEIEKKANRPQLGAEEKDVRLEVKNFNIALRAHAQRHSRPMPAEVDPDGFANYKKSLDLYLKGGRDLMTPDEVKAAQIGSDPSGGYLVTPEIDYEITRVVTNLGAMRSVATVRSIGSSSLIKVAQTSGAQFGGWGDEKTPPTETKTPDIARLEFVPGTSWAAPRATTELLEDASIDIGNWLVNEVDLIFDENESSAFISGDGVNKPRGIKSYPTVLNNNYSWGNIGYVKTGNANNFAAANPSDTLIDLMHALRRQYRGNAAFMMTDKTLAAIRKFKDGQGNYLWVPGLQGGIVGVLMGKPVVTDDFMDELGANTFPIAFADFKRAYIIVDRRGTTVLRDPFTAKPYVIFYVTRRVGGGIQNFEALKLLKCEA